ncbi:MAG TPA: UvrD-helicase domain-containing protein [Vicinamibacterales bacterium]|nr:UvrD-helicase domain-containing protein [Vicinamibacterales bacterium]
MSKALDQDPVESRIDARDREGRLHAVDPRYNVALEASAGTGKTRVLVERYVNLLRAGVDPSNILAMTFTRKAAAEMRERIIGTLRDAAARGEIAPARWRELRDRTDDIAISTIDAFCLSLLREFPLEADLDPGFDVADETEVPRLIDESLDRALRTCRSLARADEHVALVFAQLGDRRARRGLAAMLNRRLVAPAILNRYLQSGPADLTVAVVTHRGAAALLGVFTAMARGLDGFLETGPPEPSFLLLARHLRRLEASLATRTPLDPAHLQATYARAREHFLTDLGEPRKRIAFTKAQFVSERVWAAHRDLIVTHAPSIRGTFDRYKRDLNVLVSRGILRMYRIAETEYRRTLDAHAALDFADLLQRTLDLLRQMDEFAQSRYRLESRYHHVLVDEFQDTSRAQWELVSLLVQSWGEGAGLAASGPLPPSIFIVGDRKQSIYAFRDADVSILDDACRYIDALRPEGNARRTISRSFRAVPALLAFVNDVGRDVPKIDHRSDAFRYAEEDQFPVDGKLAVIVGGSSSAVPCSALGLITADSPEACADATAAEIARLLEEATVVRDKTTGAARRMTPSDVAILFRTRDSHREYEAALERRGIGAYVYKGLGFFDADEIKDVLALLWYLADPLSDMRAAALLRSRFARISDEALRRLAPHIAAALGGSPAGAALDALDAADAATLSRLRDACAKWRYLVDRVPAAELLDIVLADSAYFVEMQGPRLPQARENLKKIRALIRRIQNRGYATVGRIAAHLDRLAVGDESNAVIDAMDAVNLMTVHAAKGLEFPIVFVVNLARGTGGFRDPIRVVAGAGERDVSVAVGDFRSDADEDAAAREAEESKRLLYVALTRARDRLYLGSVLKDGTMQPGRGSLAAVLPQALIDQFAAAGDEIEWRASSGTVHRLRLIRDSGFGPRDPSPMNPEPTNRESRIPSPGTVASLQPLADPAPARRSVAAMASAETGRGGFDPPPATSGRLVGTLVHRLLQRIGIGDPGSGAQNPPPIRDVAVEMVRSNEVDDSDDLQRIVNAAVETYEAICACEDVRVLYQTGRALHEIPFTMSLDGRIVRGTIDCVVETAPGAFTILEFKTGRARPEDSQQVQLYLQALRQVFPGAPINARVVYAAGGSVLLV